MRLIMPFCLALLLLAAGCATVPSSSVRVQTPTPAPAANSRTIVVIGNGNMRVQSNLSQVNMAIDILDTSLQNANLMARQSTQQVVDALQAQGIAAEEINTSSYSVTVERNYPGIEPPDQHPEATAIPEGEIRYRVTNGIQVLVRNPNDLGAILDAAIAAGGNNLYINGIDFLYDDPDSLEHPAREKAMADAQAKAEELAQLVGVELGPVLTISEIVQHSGVYWDSDIAPLWPGQLQFYMLLQVTYAIDDAGATSATPIATATPTATEPLTNAVTIHGGNAEATREFLRQYFSQSFAFGDRSQLDIYIGTLPPELPFDLELTNLELTSGLTVVGSVVTQGEYSSSHLLFSVDHDVTESIAALRQQLEEQGYVRPAERSGGEIFQSQNSEFVPLCSPDGTFVVMINGANLADGIGTLHVHINPVVSVGPPCQAPSADGASSGFDMILPDLAAPANVSVFSSGMGSSGDSIDAHVDFRGATTVAALAEHYHAQLQADGWQQLDASQTEDVAWSGWTKTQDGQPYSVTFTIMRDAGSNDRFRATLHLERALAR